jgi:isopentenyl diphosphate isomerase/L-lactate dehydrogenase-like FMN-dependent dehydrogenase
MRDTDVVKAIILGAQCVGLGRLQYLGLAAAGRPGSSERSRSSRRRYGSAWRSSA